MEQVKAAAGLTAEKTIGALRGFKQFILRGNVVDLAVGIVIGAAFSSVVNSLVKDFLTPLIAAITPQHNFSSWHFTFRGSQFMYGDFINALLTFLIIAAAIYFFVVVPVNALVSRARGQQPADPTTKRCETCFSEIPISAKRCPACTTWLDAEEEKRAETHIPENSNLK